MYIDLIFCIFFLQWRSMKYPTSSHPIPTSLAWRLVVEATPGPQLVSSRTARYSPRWLLRYTMPPPASKTARATWNGMNYWVNYTWFLIFFLLNTDDFSDLRAILRIIYMLWGLEWIWSQWAKCEAQKIERNKMDYSNTGLQQFRLNQWIIDMGIAAVGCFVRCSSAKNHRVLMLGCTTTVGYSRGRIVF